MGESLDPDIRERLTRLTDEAAARERTHPVKLHEDRVRAKQKVSLYRDKVVKGEMSMEQFARSLWRHVDFVVPPALDRETHPAFARVKKETLF
jgi:hypothetical protein